MKKLVIMMIAILLIAIMVGSSALAEAPYFDVLTGQKVMLGDINDIVEYLSCLTRQQLLDLAVIDRGHGQFYARVLPGQTVCTWEDGEEISAYDLSEDMQEYQVLRNLMLLVEDNSGNVLTKVGMKPAFIEDRTYPELVYSERERALVEDYILAEAYPDVDARGTLSEANGFGKQEIFRALVLACGYSKVHQETVYFMAWKVVRSQVVAAPTKKPSERSRSHHSSDDETPDTTPAPRPTKKPEPENNPRPTEETVPTTRPGEPENNPRPTEFVPSGDGERSDDPDPFNHETNTGNGTESHDPDPFNGGSSGSDSESSEHTGNGTESHDPDPFNGGSSGSDSESNEHTGNGTESHDPDPFNGGSSVHESNSTESYSNESSSRPSESSSSDSNYIENNSRPSEGDDSSYDSGSSSDSGESYGSGSVSSDPDPF
jgi:hypothetical protein